MKSIWDWAFSQLVSNSMVLSRSLTRADSFFSQDPQNEQVANSGSAQISSTVASQFPAEFHNREDVSPAQQLRHDHTEGKKLDPFSRIEALQIKFLRLLQHLGQPPEDLTVAKVLYRIHLATLLRAPESDLKKINLDSNRARAVAAQQEEDGQPELDFSLKILILGKTGVGKSATINSIFDQTMAVTNAFQPSTDCIREVVGTVNGVKITVIDTPGFSSSSTSTLRRNRKIMVSIKRHIRKSPPDIVLYLERLDLINMGYSDFPLLKLVTEVFGSAIWFNTVLVMTHAASALPEGSNGFPVSYEPYVARCTGLLQRYIHQAVSDTTLENPVVLVENHPECRTNVTGEKILPNGQVWKSQLLLVCVCAKVLGDVSSFLGFQDGIGLGPSNNTRFPSVPHLLSSLLQQCSVVAADVDVDENLLSENEEEDEYDKLPSIRILTKTQFDQLSSSQKKEYFDELDYRETLLLKKQLKQELCRGRERRLLDETCSNDGNSNSQESSPEAVPLLEMAVPPSFDSDWPAHRYRCLITSERWLWRPVFDPHGWDHDVGFDGVNLETAVEIKPNAIASVSGQMSKDKQDMNIQSKATASYGSPMGPIYSLGLDVQSTGKDLLCTVHGNARSRNLHCNLLGCRVSMTSFQNKYYVGGKFEDTFYIGKTLKFVANAGRMGDVDGAAAYGGRFEATVRGRDYPVRDEKVTAAMTVLSFDKEMVLGGSFNSNFRPCRGMRMLINIDLNSRKMGKVCVKMSSSERLEIALFALFSIIRALPRRSET